MLITVIMHSVVVLELPNALPGPIQLFVELRLFRSAQFPVGAKVSGQLSNFALFLFQFFCFLRG